MFELFSGDRRRAAHRSTIPVLLSTAAHAILVGILVAIPFVYVAADLPEVPDMLAFVVSAAPPPPGGRPGRGRAETRRREIGVSRNAPEKGRR